MINIEKWKTISQEYVINTPFMTVRKDVCITDEQDVIDGYYVLEYPNWVNIVALTPQNEVILVREYRYAIDEFTTAIPAGKVEKGEKEIDAAVRELREETGFSPKEDPVFLGSFYTNAANATNKVFSYLVRNAEKVSEPEKAKGEKTEAVIMTWDEIKRSIDSGLINQVFSVLALKLAEEYLREHQENG